MTYEMAKNTATEIAAEDGINCALIYLNDLARGKDITWEDNRRIRDYMIANGYYDKGIATPTTI